MKISTRVQQLGKDNPRQFIATIPKEIREKFGLTHRQELLWEDVSEVFGIPAIVILPVPRTNNIRARTYYKKLKEEGLIE